MNRISSTFPDNFSIFAIEKTRNFLKFKQMNVQKKYLTLAILFSTMNFLYAQNETQEAELQIKKSTEALTAKNYIDASKALQKAKEEVTKLISNQLTAGLPAKFENWLPLSDSKMGMPMSMPMGMPGSNELSATKIYEMEQKADAKKDNSAATAIKKDSTPGMTAPPPAMPPMAMGAMGMTNGTPRITAIVSNNVSIASTIASINSGNNMMMPGAMGGEETKAIKIKNYRAMSKYNKTMKSGEVGIIVGAGVVQIQGSNIENVDVLQKFADQIDFQKIKAVLGE